MQQLKNDQITGLFDENLTFPNVVAQNYQSLLTHLGGIAQTRGLVKESFVSALLAREALYPTGLTTNVMRFAIPHSDAEHVIRPGVIVAKLVQPVQFKEMGSTDRIIEADYVFLLLAKKNGVQVTLLQGLMGLCSDEESVRRLDEAAGAREIYQVIIEFLQQQRDAKER